MKKTCFDNHFEIYLFPEDQTLEAPSKLNEFISFLKYNKANIPYKFSYVGLNPTLNTDLTINQNILLDYNADSLTESKDAQFQEHLKDIDNFYLSDLYSRIDIPTELPNMANLQMRKITSLIKSLLKDVDFIFLESPEENLTLDSLEIFVCALKKQLKARKQNVFISSKDLDFWKNHAQFLVGRNADFSFNCKELTHSVIEIGAYEQFYQNSEVDSDILKFNIAPKETHSQRISPRRISKIKIA